MAARPFANRAGNTIAPGNQRQGMYGLISRMRAVDGRRDELASIMADIGAMPGCLGYVVALEESDPQAIWVTEVWETAEAHAAGVNIPRVREAIRRARPLIAAFDQRIETEVLGGIGLP
jgi:quinol monooxygenase YgiN